MCSKKMKVLTLGAWVISSSGTGTRAPGSPTTTQPPHIPKEFHPHLLQILSGKWSWWEEKTLLAEFFPCPQITRLFLHTIKPQKGVLGGWVEELSKKEKKRMDTDNSVVIAGSRGLGQVEECVRGINGDGYRPGLGW